jgi:hypothetical protein
MNSIEKLINGKFSSRVFSRYEVRLMGFGVLDCEVFIPLYWRFSSFVQIKCAVWNQIASFLINVRFVTLSPWKHSGVFVT